MTDVKNTIGFATDSNAVEFNKSVNDILNARAVDAIAQRRDDLAQTVFNTAAEDMETDPIDDAELEDSITTAEVDELELDQEEPEEE